MAQQTQKGPQPPKKQTTPTGFGQSQAREEGYSKKIYAIVKKATGEIGGNGSGGPIYGELTIGNMQKIVDYLINCANLSKYSRWGDIRCGLRKPSLHVAQDLGVEFSFGIEVENLRTDLGHVNLNQVVKASKIM